MNCWGNGDGRFSLFPEVVEENEERNRNKDAVCYTVACYPSVGTMSQNSIRQNNYTNHSVLPPNDNKQHFNSNCQQHHSVTMSVSTDLNCHQQRTALRLLPLQN